MRLKEGQIRLVCQKVLEVLRTKKLALFLKPETVILARMEAIFSKELRVEDEINAEAERLLKQYESSMGSEVDRQKMLQMIKKQLIKDKGVIV